MSDNIKKDRGTRIKLSICTKVEGEGYEQTGDNKRGNTSRIVQMIKLIHETRKIGNEMVIENWK